MSSGVGFFFPNEKDGMIIDRANETRTMSVAKLYIRGEPFKKTTCVEKLFVVPGNIINSDVFRGY